MLTKFEEIHNVKIESDLLKEYINFKNENPDYIILLQLGAFYETLFEDAIIFSEITSCDLTSRNFKPKIQVAESGVPKKVLNIYLKMLLDNGLKVCICSEFKDEFGRCYREITRKYTQGTIVEDEFLETSENNYIMALYFENDIYKLAYADISTGQLYKTNCNHKGYKIETDKISPKEILIAKSQINIFKKLCDKFNITLLEDTYFNSIPETAIKNYCNDTLKKYKTELAKPIEYKCSSYMELDEVTRKNLEFTRTNYLSKRKGSLLWFLNYTKTPMGIRLLKKFLNEPLLSLNEITERQNAIEELVKNPILIKNAQEILQEFGDLSRMCSKLSNAMVLPRELVNLSRNSKLLKNIIELIDNLDSKLFKISLTKLNRILKLANTIDKAIKKDCSNDLTSGNIINEGYNAELDFQKHELNGYLKKIKQYESSQRKKLAIDNLSINYLSSIGYYIEIPSRYELKVPKEYHKKNSAKKVVRYSTDELNSIQNNINSLTYKINMLEYSLFKKVRLLASNFVESVRSISNNIALIDVLVSFAKCAVENSLVRPELKGNDIYIKEGYHPSLIKLNNEIIKNDTNLKQGSMIILTGANMSGKSTYLKHNALICILAQMGSFVPAQFAKLSLTDKIFYRQSSADDIINNNSSFMVEMNDLKYILDNATRNSLVLLDEPAKSTNARESGAIARAFCEFLLKNYKSKTIIATHNLALTELKNDYPTLVENYVMGTSVNSDSIDRKIKKGVIQKNYAIDTAILAQLPDDILNLAKSYTI